MESRGRSSIYIWNHVGAHPPRTFRVLCPRTSVLGGRITFLNCKMSSSRHTWFSFVCWGYLAHSWLCLNLIDIWGHLSLSIYIQPASMFTSSTWEVLTRSCRSMHNFLSLFRLKRAKSERHVEKAVEFTLWAFTESMWRCPAKILAEPSWSKVDFVSIVTLLTPACHLEISPSACPPPCPSASCPPGRRHRLGFAAAPLEGLGAGIAGHRRGAEASGPFVLPSCREF